MVRVMSRVEQVAVQLRAEILRGRWQGMMPGGARLAEEMLVGRKLVEGALRQLESEGLLMSGGRRCRRRIVLPAGEVQARGLRVALLLYEKSDRKLDYVVDLQHKLLEAGHATVVSGTTLTGLGMDVGRVARLVKDTKADAWVVLAGSREVLEWFAGQPVPTFALFGRGRHLMLAGTGPDKLPALRAIVARLAGLGHRRMVMLAREERRKPQPGLFEQAFLNELEAHGISPGPYHLPDWENSRKGFHRCLDSLFRYSPPTALLISQAPLFVAAQQHLAGRGIVAPRQVSMICHDPDPAFAWCEPAISHIRWDPDPMVRRIVRWADNVARGKADRRMTRIAAEFVEGGTIGPVNGRSQ
jgi:DNA-binding LacI/PurR family transcriptional regulator